VEKKEAIALSCDEILEGKHHGHFVVDMVQGGAGTSTNMVSGHYQRILITSM
jgi:aspartate ammonia-lyase